MNVALWEPFTKLLVYVMLVPRLPTIPFAPRQPR